MKNPFDEFSRSLAHNDVSRRDSLRRLGSALAGALIAPFVIGAKSASANPDSRPRRRRRSGLRLPGGKNRRDACTVFCSRCSNKARRDQCLAVCRGCNNDPRRLNGACGNYVCCGAGQKYCSGRCVDLKTDPNNCGSCGHVCGADSQCINGTCSEVTCPAGLTRCGTTCVDLSSDINNCGACGNFCSVGSVCVSGVCQSDGQDCPPGYIRCSGICVNLDWDSNHCGACFNQCPPNSACAFGICGTTGGEF